MTMKRVFEEGIAVHRLSLARGDSGGGQPPAERAIQMISTKPDKLIYTYFGVDTMLVWRTVVNRVPELRREIQRIVVEEGGR